jgi:hypothetical protein
VSGPEMAIEFIAELYRSYISQDRGARATSNWSPSKTNESLRCQRSKPLAARRAYSCPELFIRARANIGDVWLWLTPTSRSRAAPFRFS